MKTVKDLQESKDKNGNVQSWEMGSIIGAEALSHEIISMVK